MDFQSARVKIDTIIFTPINSWICFALEGKIYDVHVFEFQREVRGNPHDVNRNSEMGGRCSHGETNKEGEKSLSRQEDGAEREEAGDKNLMIVISQEDDNVKRVERVDNGLTNPRTLTMHFSNHVEKDMEVYNGPNVKYVSNGPNVNNGRNNMDHKGTEQSMNPNLEECMFLGLSRNSGWHQW